MMILEGPPALVGSVAFSEDSTLLAAGAQDGTARVWDSSGTLVLSFDTELAGSKCPVAFQPQGNWLAISTDARLFLRPLALGEPTGLHHRTPGVATDLSFITPEMLVVGTGKRGGTTAGGYYIYDLAKKSIRQPIQTEPHGIRALTTQPASKLLAWVTGNNLLRWGTITKPGFEEIRLGHAASSITIHPQGKSLAAGIDWKVRTFDMPSRSERLALTGHKGQVTAVSYHPNGRMLASGSWDETVRIWDVPGGAEIACYQWRIGKVLCLAYSPDGTRLVAGTDRGLVAIWDVE